MTEPRSVAATDPRLPRVLANPPRSGDGPEYHVDLAFWKNIAWSMGATDEQIAEALDAGVRAETRRLDDGAGDEPVAPDAQPEGSNVPVADAIAGMEQPTDGGRSSLFPSQRRRQART